ncbi:MAG: alpha/beta fold hydrolase [Pseudomonadota bacterium]
MAVTLTLTLPRLGETMEEGTLTAWLVEPGARFARGDALIEIETDKTAVEFPALGPGRLVSTLVAPGDHVTVGDPIATIDLEGADDWVSKAPSGNDNAERLIDLPMPRLGETMEEGVIVAWMVGEGEPYRRGDAILEVETDKTTAEFPALEPGRLVKILAKPGETVAVGTAIAKIAVAAEDAPPPAAPTRGSPPDTPTERAARVSAPAPAPDRPAHAPLRATPIARRAARDAGVPLATLRGTGRRGRIELSDVIAATGDTLAETTYGPADGTPVLLVHGYAGDRLTLDQLGQGLGKARFFARAIDLPAHGEAAAEARGFDDLVTAARDTLRERPSHVVAHSLGAAVVVRAVASGAPARSLTLLAPAGLGPAIDGTFIAGMADPVSEGAVSHLLRRLSPRAAGFSDAMVAQIFAKLQKGRLKALAADIAVGDRQTLDITRDLARLSATLPIRIVVGHRDAILDWRDALTISPAIAVHHLPNAGHMPHWDAPDVVRDLIIKSSLR